MKISYKDIKIVTICGMKNYILTIGKCAHYFKSWQELKAYAINL